MRLVGIVFILLGLLLRIAMSFAPSLPLCVLFWGLVLGGFILLALYHALPGAICNAAAMIANGGFMPVFNQIVSGGGVHIQGTSDAALQILCDQFLGFSIGDFLLAVGLLCGWAARRSNSNPPAGLMQG